MRRSLIALLSLAVPAVALGVPLHWSQTTVKLSARVVIWQDTRTDAEILCDDFGLCDEESMDGALGDMASSSSEDEERDAALDDLLCEFAQEKGNQACQDYTGARLHAQMCESQLWMMILDTSTSDTALDKKREECGDVHESVGPIADTAMSRYEQVTAACPELVGNLDSCDYAHIPY
jgi:hypothetical protein